MDREPQIGQQDKEKVSVRGGRSQRVARAGEYYVAAEINKRGAYAVTFAGNMPKIDLMACNHDQSRTVHIQVKTKRGGRSWHSSILDGHSTAQPDDPLAETIFWIFVDLGENDHLPRYWIVPDGWIRNDIYVAHQKYLDRHGGRRAQNQSSTHHSIDEGRLSVWEGTWQVLGVFDIQ